MHDKSIMYQRRISQIFLCIALLFIFSGCNENSSKIDDGPFGPPKESKLLSPFAGQWRFDFEKTLNAQKAAGATEENLNKIRKLYNDNPELGKMHSDLVIIGNIAVGKEVDGSDMPPCEYDFFSVHKHGDKTCGKAWHHEDRYDPGDMSKCYVRLKIKDNDLYFEVKMQEGLPDQSDPDFGSMPAIDLDSDAQCDAEQPKSKNWSDWSVYVFTRK